MSISIESLELEVKASSESASSGIEALIGTLESLKQAVSGTAGLTKIANSIKRIGDATQKAGSAAGAIAALGKSLKSLDGLQKITISSSIANQVTKISDAVGSMPSGTASNIQGLAASLGALSALPKGGLGSIAGALEKMPAALNEMAKLDYSSTATQMQALATALEPLTKVSKAAGLTSTVNALQKIPKVTKELDATTLKQFAEAMQSIATSITPLASQLDKVGTAFSRLPSKMKQVSNAANAVTQSNQQANRAFLGQGIRLAGLWASLKIASNQIAKFINESNRYVEDMNLFNVAMGDYADSAARYAKKVSEVMGIDPAAWMRNQGIFQTLAEGFGVASDRAAIMSKNLTQLGYDLSSFFNIATDDAMQKLQSGISGELEPLNLAA